MNHLKKISKLNNKYHALRHGDSEANVLKIINSNPETDLKKYGLTDIGKTQIAQNLSHTKLDSKTIIYTSNFLRTVESAKVAQKTLLINSNINISPKLRERFFGSWNNSSTNNYQNVWKEDLINPDHKINEVESTNEVLDRTTSLIIELEKKFNQKNILLISHGDSLQILQTGFLKINSSKHRTIKHLELGELRSLQLS